MANFDKSIPIENCIETLKEILSLLEKPEDAKGYIEDVLKFIGGKVNETN